MDRAAQRLACGLAIVLAIGYGAYVGLAAPRQLDGVAGWSAVVLAVLYGYGGGVRRALRIQLSIGEQLVAGTIVWVGVGGGLLVLGIASRPTLLGLVAIGGALALLDVASFALREPKARPGGGETVVAWALGIALAIVLVVNLLATAGTRANPYDDQSAYVGFVKRLLDIGDLHEPFSLRRLSAYGGQTLLQALAATRGDVTAIDLLDRGIFQIIGFVLVLGVMARRRLHLGLRAAVIVFLVSLVEMSANSAALWTGFCCFLGAYAFASRDDLSPRHALGLAFGCCAVACTLRQNYLVPAGLFAALLLAFHVRDRARATSWRQAIADERGTIATTIIITLAILLPYMIAAWRTFDTVLYPILLGTADPDAPLRPTQGTLLDELVFFVNVSISSEPIRIWWLLVPLMLLARDRRARRPWTALLLASLLGFAMLVHSFTLSDAHTLWRYAFGYMTALAVVFVVEAAARLPVIPRADDSSVGGTSSSPSTPPANGMTPASGTPASSGFRLHAIAAFAAWLALLVHFVENRIWISHRVTTAQHNLEAALEFGTAKYDPRGSTIERLQAAIPEGAPIAAMLDDPYFLDFARNPIASLDLVGFVAPPPGTPSFTSPAHWRAYLRGQGFRYAVFAEPQEAAWLYRRQGWVYRMYADDELFRYIAAHLVDAIDSLQALARESTVIFHADGLYAVDLGTEVPPEPPRGAPKRERMDTFARELSIRELGTNAWQLASRRDVIFKPSLAGPSHIAPVPGFEPAHFDGVMGVLYGARHQQAYRWISDRSHVRLRGDGGTYHLRVRAWINTARLQSRPYLSLQFGGQLVGKAQPGSDGMVTLEADLACDGWCSLYIVLSTMPEWWLSADSMKGAKLLEFEWTRVR